ncbi:MAG: thioredoxin family protein [Clostridia bacterium]|nr:thioredoxin family protein [Clostridia bacterium]
MVETWNGEDFEKRLEAVDQLAVVEFYTKDCPSCKTMAMIFDSIAKEWQEDHREVRFAKVNVEHEERLLNRYRIRSVPTILVFRRGKPVVESVGNMGRGRLQELIRSAL